MEPRRMYGIVYSRRAVKELRRLTPKLRERIRAKITQVAQDPYAQNNNLTRLQGRDGYRLPVGEWRVLYDLYDGRRIMDILTIVKREEAYR